MNNREKAQAQRERKNRLIWEKFDQLHREIAQQREKTSPILSMTKSTLFLSTYLPF